MYNKKAFCCLVCKYYFLNKMSNDMSMKGGGLVSLKVLLCLRLPVISINIMGNYCSFKSMYQERKEKV